MAASLEPSFFSLCCDIDWGWLIGLHTARLGAAAEHWRLGGMRDVRSAHGDGPPGCRVVADKAIKMRPAERSDAPLATMKRTWGVGTHWEGAEEIVAVRHSGVAARMEIAMCSWYHGSALGLG